MASSGPPPPRAMFVRPNLNYDLPLISISSLGIKRGLKKVFPKNPRQMLGVDFIVYEHHRCSVSNEMVSKCVQKNSASSGFPARRFSSSDHTRYSGHREGLQIRGFRISETFFQTHPPNFPLSHARPTHPTFHFPDRQDPPKVKIVKKFEKRSRRTKMPSKFVKNGQQWMEIYSCRPRVNSSFW